MTVQILIFFLFASGIQAACLPDSLDLVKNLSNSEMQALEDTVLKFEAVVTRELPRELDLIIHLEPLNPRINAEVVKDMSIVTISVWGGMLMHSKMSPPTLSLLLCHELGHLLGGPPLKSRTGWSSTEGQADYYSTAGCFKDLGFEEGQFFDAALNLTSIYAEVVRQAMPQIDRCDPTVVSRTNFSYPNVQCRLDTLVAGWRNEARPKCWFLD